MEKTDNITKLLTACKRGDQTAQMQVYQRYAKAMYQVAMRITGHPDDAEDVMQEAFIKAFDKLDTFKATASFGAWLKRIVINEALSYLRKQRKFEDIENQNIAIEPEPVIELNDKNVKIEVLMEAINRLKDNYRIAINLHFIEGYDYEEMTRILNLSYANVRTLVSRAKHKLKQILEKDYREILKKY